MTVGELGVRMSARELVWWEALLAVEAEEREQQAERAGRR